MNIGVVKERKDHENRVSLTPAGVKALCEAGHKVTVEKDAGAGSGFPDHDYLRVGGTIESKAENIYEASDLILKVKEPIAEEYPLLRNNQYCLPIYTLPHVTGVLRTGYHSTGCNLVRRLDGTAQDRPIGRNVRQDGRASWKWYVQ